MSPTQRGLVPCPTPREPKGPPCQTWCITWIPGLFLHNVVRVFKDENLPLFTVHDAFYVRLVDIEVLKHAYFDSLFKIYTSQPWYKFIHTNQVSKHEIINPSNKGRKIIEEFNAQLSEMDKSIRLVDSLI